MDILEIIDSIIFAGTLIGVMIILFELLSIVETEKEIKRKRKKNLDAKRSEKLHELGFVFVDNLYFEGVYRGFFIQVNPTKMYHKKKEEVNCNVIQAFYQPIHDYSKDDTVKPISYHLGMLSFFSTTVIFIPKNYIQPDFKANFEGIVNILIREGYKPISKMDLLILEKQKLLKQETCIE